MIRAVIFDFGNVICSFDVHRFLRNLAPFTPLSFSDLQNVLPELSVHERRYESGKITSEQFLKKVVDCCRLTISRDDFVRAYVDIFTPIPQTMKLLGVLKPHYKLGLLSNTNDWHFEHGIRPVEVYPLFDSISLSFRVGAMKPAREIYLDALAKLEVPAAECVYIDDLEENVQAAESLGMIGIRFISPPHLEARLRDLSIMP